MADSYDPPRICMDPSSGTYGSHGPRPVPIPIPDPIPIRPVESVPLLLFLLPFVERVTSFGGSGLTA
ncbi:MAG TPA: hypothetical protein VJN63_08260 [Thermoplasmata archaeon]|nr:hypothetical protein [Thermoplasmata archaeon]